MSQTPHLILEAACRDMESNNELRSWSTQSRIHQAIYTQIEQSSHHQPTMKYTNNNIRALLALAPLLGLTSAATTIQACNSQRFLVCCPLSSTPISEGTTAGAVIPNCIPPSDKQGIYAGTCGSDYYAACCSEYTVSIVPNRDV